MLETPELTALHNDSLANVLSQEQISLRAYRLYALRGYVDGLDLQDWLQAEREVLWDNSSNRPKQPVPPLDDRLVRVQQTETQERDGFKVRRKTFAQPPNTALADPVTKRKVTICNLFANHRLSIADILRVLDEDYARIVVALIEQGLIHERRKTRREPAQPGRALHRKY